MKIYSYLFVFVTSLSFFCNMYESHAYSYSRCEESCFFCDDLDEPYVHKGGLRFYVGSNLGADTDCDENVYSSKRNDFECAVYYAENQPGNSVSITTVNDTDGWSRDDIYDQSDVYVLDPIFFDSTTFAITWNSRDCDCCFPVEIEESDIGFNSSKVFHEGPKRFGHDGGWIDTSARVFRETALHEIGHALGLKHFNSMAGVSRMQQGSAGPRPWTTGDPTGLFGSWFNYNGQISFQADDLKGLDFLYPSSNIGRDIIMLRGKKYLDPVTSSITSGDLPWLSDKEYCQGEDIIVEFTHANHGDESFLFVDTRMEFTSDTNYNSGNINGGIVTNVIISPFTSKTITETFTVPSSIMPGDYYIILRADPNNSIVGEFDEVSNNVIFLHHNFPGSPDKFTILPSSHPNCP